MTSAAAQLERIISASAARPDARSPLGAFGHLSARQSRNQSGTLFTNASRHCGAPVALAGKGGIHPGTYSNPVALRPGFLPLQSGRPRWNSAHCASGTSRWLSLRDSHRPFIREGQRCANTLRPQSLEVGPQHSPKCQVNNFCRHRFNLHVANHGVSRGQDQEYFKHRYSKSAHA